MIFRVLATLSALALLQACSPDPGQQTPDAGTDASQPSPDRARVFEVNPVSTPEPVEVELSGVADDAGGRLISAEDAFGLRRIQVLSCRDEGATNTINVGAGPQLQRICTLRAMADKYENGDFVYEDWDNAVNGVFDASDLHAEVELYHHATKIYDLVTDARVGLFDFIPGRHEVDGELVPLTLVANYQYPGGFALQPFPQAMYLRRESLQVGMGAIMGLSGIEGDVMIFGQGPAADFSYDGETVYHEFGHLLNEATAGLRYRICKDAQGMHNLHNALEQGLSETFVFLTSEQTRLFEYLDQVTTTGGFARTVDGDDRFPESLQGLDQFDGLIVAAANYEAFQRLQQEGLDRIDFLRLLLKTLMSLDGGRDCLDFAAYAEGFLDALVSEGRQTLVAPLRAIFESRGLFEIERAKDADAYRAEDHESLYVGGALQAPWNDWLELELEGQVRPAATAMLQLRLTPAAAGSLQFSALVLPASDAMDLVPDDEDWDFRLAMRAAQPVAYREQDDGSWSVELDGLLAPDSELVEIPGGPVLKLTWTIDAPLAGQTLYLHPLNLGAAPAFLVNLDLQFL